MSTIISRIKQEIETYTEPIDILSSILATALLLFLSFIGFSTLTMTHIYLKRGIGIDALVYITYYGFPLPMIGILTPIGNEQTSAALWYQMLGNSNVQILWAGLFFNITIYFLISFLVIYLYRRFIRR